MLDNGDEFSRSKKLNYEFYLYYRMLNIKVFLNYYLF